MLAGADGSRRVSQGLGIPCDLRRTHGRGSFWGRGGWSGCCCLKAVAENRPEMVTKVLRRVARRLRLGPGDAGPGDAAGQAWGQVPAHRRPSPPTWSSRPVGTHGPAGLPDLAWKSLSSAPGGCLSTAWRPWGRLGTLWCLCVGKETGVGGPGSEGSRTWNPSAF